MQQWVRFGVQMATIWRQTTSVTLTNPKLNLLLQLKKLKFGENISPNCNVHCQFETNFAQEKGLTKVTNSATGFLEIDYDGEWEG